MSKIALVGLGLVGRAWAIGFARSGHEVALWDEKSDAVDGALRYAEEVLPGLASNGSLTILKRAGAFGAKRGLPMRLRNGVSVPEATK